MNSTAVIKMKRHLKHADRLLSQSLLQSCTMQVFQLRDNFIIRGQARLVRHLSIPQLHSIATHKFMAIHKPHLLLMNRITYLK